MSALDRLKGMVGKPYLYKNDEVVILNYCEGTGDDGDEVEIYLNNGKTLVFNYINLPSKLEKFKPVSAQVIVLANKRLDSVSTVNPSIIQELRDTVMQQIEAVKKDPSAVNQAKQVFQGVNTLVNLAKTELEYRKYMNELDKPLNQ
ncbi:hypothetical protein [uncultured Bacteroides sp.]|uniref:hypothetical protein n=1 Tax=uncultured Bacteroides sp. TaxID=162156 RepID=UPI00260F94FD|nr:hypothetical protein [uncultured Bacteroides sp.]